MFLRQLIFNAATAPKALVQAFASILIRLGRQFMLSKENMSIKMPRYIYGMCATQFINTLPAYLTQILLVNQVADRCCFWKL